MIEEQRQTAEAVATELQKTGIISELTIGIEIIYQLYELYKFCYPDKHSAAAYLATEYNGTDFSRRVMKPAIRRTLQSVRKNNLEVTDDQIEEIAKQSLLGVMNAGSDVVTACYVS